MTAENGDDASYILPKMQRIDLLLTDIRMPGRNQRLASCRNGKMPPSEPANHLHERVSASAGLEGRRECLSRKALSCRRNSERNSRADALSHAGSDSTDILNGMQIATIFLDRTFAVKYFTPSAKNIFDLVESDIGRPISHIRTRLRLNSVQEYAERVLRTLGTIEKQVDSHNGAKRYIMRMLPYRTLKNVMESESFRLARELQSRVEKLEQILDLLPAGLFVIGNVPAQHVQVNRYGLRLLGEKK